MDYDSPAVVNSRISHKVAGTNIDMVIVVYPTMYAPYIEKLALTHSNIYLHKPHRVSKVTREQFITKPLVFVMNTYVRNVIALLNQKQSKVNNPMYDSVINAIRGIPNESE